jgi:hypothetical protein
MQSLLPIPDAIRMLGTEPATFYSRMHDGPHFEYFDHTWAQYMQVEADERGFVTTFAVPSGAQAFDTFDELRQAAYRVVIAPHYQAWEDTGVEAYRYLLAITPEYVFFRDPNSFLFVPTHFAGAWVLEAMDIRELFNHLALYNRYFTSMVAPAFIPVYLVYFITQVMVMIAAVWLFGYWTKLSGNMSIKERFAVCTFAMVPANIIAFAIGLLPMMAMHGFIAQLIMIYVSYKAMKEYWNA